MTSLTCGTRQTRIETPILHNAGPDPRTDEHADKVTQPLSRAVEVFAQGGYLDIIANRNRFAKLLVEDRTQRHVLDTQVRGVHDDPRFTINLSRRPDTDGNNASIRG